MKSTFALLAFGLLLSACAGSSSLSKVAVYESLEEVPREYSILSVIRPGQGIQSSGYVTNNTRIKRARMEALQMGANGLLILSEDSPAIDGAIRRFIGNMGEDAPQRSNSVSRKVMLAILVHADDASES